MCNGSVHVQVKDIVKGGVAEKGGDLKRGDRLVSVNGQKLDGTSKMEALQIISQAGKVLLFKVR